MRTIIDLPEEHISQLAELCEREQLSRAELVRRAVSEYLRQHGCSDADEAFGLWRDRPIDPLALEDDIRDEWER